MNLDIHGNRNKIIDSLLNTQRPNMIKLLDWMDAMNFYTMPCSTDHHLACEGGLAQHSLNVMHTMREIADAVCTVENRPTLDTIKICALLHDLGKVGDHAKFGYVENLVNSKTKNKETGTYDLVVSEAKPYKTNPSLLYIPHEVRSVVIAERYIQLTEEEEHAILMHNGLYGDMKMAFTGKEQPLDLLLHFADLWCCRITEDNKEVR